MKNLITSAIVATGIATSGIAGAVETPTYVAAPMEPASVTDWSGFYVGGIASFDSGTRDYGNSFGIFASYDLDAETGYGAFAGYNLQRGSFVYGAELAYFGEGIGDDSFPDDYHTFFADLKLRAGYTLGDALIYGLVGASASSWSTSAEYPVSGMNYGAGIDYQITDSLFVGAEYLVRDMSAFREGSTATEGFADIQSAQIRAGWRF